MKLDEKNIDELLENFFSLYNNKEFDKLKRITSDEKFSEINLNNYFSEDLLVFLYLIKNEELLKYISKDSTKKKIRDIENIMKNELIDLFNHPFFNKEMAVDIKIENPLTHKFNTPTGVIAFPFLQGYPPELKPGVRLGILRKGNILIDMTLEWDNLTFLANIMIKILNEQVLEYKVIKDNFKIEIKNERIKAHIDEMDRNITQLKELLNEYDSAD
jgi:hypothetical protein